MWMVCRQQQGFLIKCINDQQQDNTRLNVGTLQNIFNLHICEMHFNASYGREIIFNINKLTDIPYLHRTVRRLEKKKKDVA